MSQESQRDHQEGVCMKHMNEDDPLCAKKEAKIIRMVVGDDVFNVNSCCDCVKRAEIFNKSDGRVAEQLSGGD